MGALKVLLVVIAFLTVGGSHTRAERRSCMWLPNTCEMLAEAAAVLEATVESTEIIRSSPTVWSSTDSCTVVLSDVKAWRGAAASVVSTSESTCAADFKKGVRYLIVAYRGADGGLRAGISCGLTRPLSEAQGLLDYLQLAIPAGTPPPSRVWGQVKRATKWEDYTREFVGVPDAQVTFRGKTTRSVTTGADGRYVVTGLPAGDYTITVNPPAAIPELGPAEPLNDFDLSYRSAPACAEMDFVTQIKSAISGVVVDEKGQPVNNVFVQLQFPGQIDLSRGRAGAGYTTGPDGSYEFTGLPPGRYVIGLNLERKDNYSLLFPFAPVEAVTASGATVITLAFGERMTLRPIVARRMRIP